MHDPMTVAFEIKSPFKRRNRIYKDYREPLVTIWHRDPELHGDDDSCGWAYVTLRPADREWARQTAAKEWPFWFSPEYHRINLLYADQFAVLAAAWAECRLYVLGAHVSAPLSAWDMGHVLSLVSNAGDNFGHLISEARRANAERGEEGMEDLLAMTLKIYLTARRPWWKHPNFHVRHWSFQVHGWQRVNRWAFSRCSRCGGRFRWRECPVSGSWHGSGPRFLRGEPNVWHHSCDRAGKEAKV